jgi:hypothetical protein
MILKLPYCDGLGLLAKTQRYAKSLVLYWPRFQVISVFKVGPVLQ